MVSEELSSRPQKASIVFVNALQLAVCIVNT